MACVRSKFALILFKAEDSNLLLIRLLLLEALTPALLLPSNQVQTISLEANNNKLPFPLLED